MFRTSLVALFLLCLLILPATTLADNSTNALESVVSSGIHVQTGLNNFLARVETSRIAEMMDRLTKGMPDNVKPPSQPVIRKFWQSHGKGLVFAESNGLTPYVEKIVKQVSKNVAIELDEMVLPAGHAQERRDLLKTAQVKTSEVVLGNTTINQVEINFEAPTDLNEAFYVTGMRLPQKQITSLGFDIDSGMGTVNELRVSTADGLQLTVEMRYLKVADGYIPERFQITSPDGSIDDMFEVKFTEINGYMLPASMQRTIRRPDIKEDLIIYFKDYQINQPISADIQNRLDEM